MPSHLDLVRHIALLAVAVISVYTDLARGKLYNVVTLGGTALGVALAYLMDGGSSGLPHLKAALIGAALGGGLMFVVYLLGGFGAGEVKLMAAVGALAPFQPEPAWKFVLYTLAYTALIGSAMGIIALILQKRLLSGLKESARAMVTLRVKRNVAPPQPGMSLSNGPGANAVATGGGCATSSTIPYGVAIGIGVVWAWLEIVL